eukprot:4175659-Alexandrium_andersonii.AAC.1
MERLWWQFSEAWKKVHGRGGRTLSFGRSRHLTDYPKVVAYLSGPTVGAIARFLEQEALHVAEDFEAAMCLAHRAAGTLQAPAPDARRRSASSSGVRGGA